MGWTSRLVVIGLAALLAGCAGKVNEPSESTRLASPSPTQSVEPSATETASPSPETASTPVSDAQLAVGWAVPFTVTAPADWGIGVTTATAVEVVDGTGLRTVLAAYLKSPDLPEVWIERLTTHEALDVSEPQPVELGGGSGHVFDVRLNDSAPACAAGGSSLGGSCLIIHGPEDGWAWGIEDGRPARIWVLEVEGETVILSSDAREDRFEAWVPVIGRVVDSIEWQEP